MATVRPGYVAAQRVPVTMPMQGSVAAGSPAGALMAMQPMQPTQISQHFQVAPMQQIPQFMPAQASSIQAAQQNLAAVQYQQVQYQMRPTPLVTQIPLGQSQSQPQVLIRAPQAPVMQHQVMMQQPVQQQSVMLHKEADNDQSAASIANTVMSSQIHASGPLAARPVATEIKADWHVPNVQLMFKGAQTTLHQILVNKKGIIFGVPGAFTPVCSHKHVPGFRDALPYLKEAVDFIACVAVNDPCVLKAWAKELRIPRDIVLIADWECKFTKALGLELDASSFHMGTRCRRFCILVSEGTIVWFGLEGDAFVDKVAIILSHLGLMSAESLEAVKQVAERIEAETAARREIPAQEAQRPGKKLGEGVDENEDNFEPKARDMPPVHEGEEPSMSTDENENGHYSAIAGGSNSAVSRREFEAHILPKSAPMVEGLSPEDEENGDVRGMSSIEDETEEEEEGIEAAEDDEEDIVGEEGEELEDPYDYEDEEEEEDDEGAEAAEEDHEIVERGSSIMAGEIEDEVRYIRDSERLGGSEGEEDSYYEG